MGMKKIIIKQGDWTTKKLTIKDKTTRTLLNGKVIATWLNMQRQITKYA